LRRLKYPSFDTSIAGTDLYNETTAAYNPAKYANPGTIYTPIQVNSELGPNLALQRFKYAESSSSRNSKIPKDVDGNVPVFWAK
jgi:hypothetical protein